MCSKVRRHFNSMNGLIIKGHGQALSLRELKIRCTVSMANHLNDEKVVKCSK